MSTPGLDRVGKIAFVPARYGPTVVGGAELVLAEAARGFKDRGWDVEVLTTCATDHYSWSNDLPEGLSDDNGIPVRRFAAVFDDVPERGELEAAVMAGHQLSITDQQRWINAGMRSPALFHYLLDRSADYRAIVFTPYPFWVTFAGSQIDPGRSVLWTCLHDEPYAYLDLFQPVFTGVAGLFFQTGPEHDLAHRITEFLAPHAEVGCLVEAPQAYDPEAFRVKYDIEGPFLLYAGRREGGKGWDTLLDNFAAAVERRELPFKLVTMGAGAVNPPASIMDRVVDLGFLPNEDRDNAFAAASAYIQPSQYEAFSRTVMEAWLAGIPVIANGDSEVVAWHCQRSGAGLTYRDAFEFEQCLAFLADEPEQAVLLAKPGREYVIGNYAPELVLDRMEAKIVEWTKP